MYVINEVAAQGESYIWMLVFALAGGIAIGVALAVVVRHLFNFDVAPEEQWERLMQGEEL